MSDRISQLFASGRPVTVAAGETVFRNGDAVQVIYLVSHGQIDLIRHTARGAPLTLSRAMPGQVLAEASAYSKHYHCDAIAQTPAQLTALPVARFRARLAADPETAELWAAQLARQLQRARMLSEIRSLKTVADRVDVWLGEGNALPPKGQIQDLARLLGVSREALYRDLARRRADPSGP